MMIIPVMTTSCERSFSQLNLIKTYLKSTVIEGHLNNLALINIENDIDSKLDLNEAITNFTNLKLRKVFKITEYNNNICTNDKWVKDKFLLLINIINIK